MNREQLESLIIDYIDGKLNEQDKALVERELAADEATYQLYAQLKEVIEAMERSSQLEPSVKLKKDFDELLKEEIAKEKPAGRTVFFSPMLFRAAAAIALVLSGVAIGFWITKNQQREAQLLAMQQQMEEMKMLMMSQLKDTQSASKRMIAVSQVMEMDKPDDEIVLALVKTMNEDSNTNVRLAAMDALSKFHQDPLVRKELIKSLSKQKDPVVQIALIQLLVKMKEKGVVNDLKKIVDDQQNMKAVKDEAYSGLLKLS